MTSVKQLPYSLEKTILVYTHKNRFLDIFPWPNFFQAYCMLTTSNMVYEMAMNGRVFQHVVDVVLCQCVCVTSPDPTHLSSH